MNIEKTKEQIERIKEICGGWGLYEQSDPISQQLKALSECGELCDSINKGDYEQAKDDIGDIFVCLVNWSEIGGRPLILPQKDSKPTIGGPEKEIAVIIAGTITAKFGSGSSSTLSFLRSISNKIGADFNDCVQIAINEIAKRTGKMINGTFVKDDKNEKVFTTDDLTKMLSREIMLGNGEPESIEIPDGFGDICTEAATICTLRGISIYRNGVNIQ